MNANGVFLSELRNKAKRKGTQLEDLLEEVDRAKSGRMNLNLFRKLVANTGLYVEDDKFLDMVEPYTQNNQFFYAQFISDVDNSNQGDNTQRLSDDQLREFGAPLRDRGVDLVDFLRQWDRQRSGHVATSIFLRNVSSTPLGQIVCRAYTNPITNDVEYVKLWQDVERVLAAKYTGNPIDPQKMQVLINYLADVVKQQGIDLFAQFQRIDRFKKRRVQPSQFLQVIDSLGVKNVPPQDLTDLCDTFTENAVFDYVSFCDEIDRANALKAQIKPVPQPVKIDVDQVLARIAKEFHNRHSQLRAQFTQFDTQNNGIIPAARFIRAVMNQGFSVTDAEIEAVAQDFGDGRGNVDYISFVNFVMPPQEPAVKVEDVLVRLQDFLNLKKIQLQPLLKKFDLRNKGEVPFSKLQAVLRDISFDLTNEETNAVKQQFAGPGADGPVNIIQICELVDPIIEAPKPRPVLPKKEYVEPATLALDVMTKIGAIVSRYQLDIFEDFRRYDTKGTGLIKDGEFAAVIASLPSAPNESDIQALLNFYSNPGSHIINYESFCQEMDEFAMKRLQQNPEMTTKMMGALPSAPPSAKPVLKRFKMHLYATKISPDVLFTPYDSNHCGLIASLKLKPILDDCGFRTSDEDIRVLIDAFQDQRLPEKISYKRLCGELNDIRLTQSDLAMTQETGMTSMKQTMNPEVLRFTSEFREKLLERHKRIAQPFVGVRSQAMPAMDFRRCLESFGLVIKETDMQKIFREYRLNMQGDIDWQRFVQDVETIKTV
ncbi:EF hand family protein [Tritrichomonas foetus]|uniref:EF hand family protein n=1 Tax=Tritrichomonas foetus TaxID=1144522 RepID=A0A1J4KT50_9EUKA|nr:EF hand family protein [Tritrichomonas foetus]|eukprot:OHT14471.1 EF hand family protein [Tritrichomonas foetus]